MNLSLLDKAKIEEVLNIYIIPSFSGALAQDLNVNDSDEAFTNKLSDSIETIYQASISLLI